MHGYILTDQKLDGTVYAHLTYDTYSRLAAGRLTQATVAGTSFTYAFGSQDASCNGLPGSNANSGKSSNRTSQTIAGLATTYCYDQADRLIAASNPNYTSTQYDAHGNTRFLGQETTTSAKTEFTYDSSDRLRQLTQTQTSQPTKALFYGYDVANRLKYRNVQQNWVSQSTQNYGYTGAGDTPDFTRDNTSTITEKYLSLPGGVNLTIRPGATPPADKTYTLTNLHSDTMTTTSATGSVLSTHLTGPFGEKLSTYPTIPNNASVNGATFQYVGAHEKLTEGDLTITLIHMGARTYLPQIGRFTQVDPVQGGTPNSYAYPTDPANDFDLSGQINWRRIGTFRSHSRARIQ